MPRAGLLQPVALIETNATAMASVASLLDGFLAAWERLSVGLLREFDRFLTGAALKRTGSAEPVLGPLMNRVCVWFRVTGIDRKVRAPHLGPY